MAPYRFVYSDKPTSRSSNYLDASAFPPPPLAFIGDQVQRLAHRFLRTPFLDFEGVLQPKSAWVANRRLKIRCRSLQFLFALRQTPLFLLP